MGPSSTLEKLRSDLLAARKARDEVEASTIRSLIAAIENAAAIEDTSSTAEPLIGLNHDQPRRLVDTSEINEILGRERTELADAAAEYHRLGLDQAAELERRVAIVDRYLNALP